MKNDSWTVYKHTAPNGKSYIGITCLPLSERWRNDGSGYKRQPFYHAIQKYGWDNISHEILFTDLSKEAAEEIEISLIKKHRTLLSENGYNSATGGGVNRGFTLSDETKQKLRERHLGKKASAEARKRMSEAQRGEKCYWYGKHLDEATKAKIRASRMGSKNPMYGKSRSDEFKKQLSQRVSGENNPNYGVRRTGSQNGMYGKHHKPETIELYKQINSGAGNPKSRPVYQYDDQMNIIHRFEYIGEAVKELGLQHNAKNGIIACCRGRQKTAHGYKWGYAPVEDRAERNVLGTMNK